MADAIRTFASDPELRQGLARRGREEAARQTLELQAARVLAFFAEAPLAPAR
jgi:glycosyltransferase involved in cell wall biosynthesis